MYDLVIVQCVKSKIWDKDKTAPKFVPAKDAYVSPYFKKMRAFAEKYGKRWAVLSGKYGFLLPETKIENYNATFSRATFANPTSDPISIEEIKKRLRTDESLRSGLGLNTITTCVVLGGNAYVKVAEEVLSEYRVQVVDLLKGLKFGEKLGWLDRKVGPEPILSSLSKKRFNQTYKEGEQEVIKLVRCPNCGKELMLLPPNYPLYDTQCTGCVFRAQVKTNKTKPKKEIFGATWDVMSKVLKSGFITPPLIVSFKWEEGSVQKQEIRFYPFVPKKNLKKYFTKIKKTSRELWMFNYTGLDKLPYFVVYKR